MNLGLQQAINSFDFIRIVAEAPRLIPIPVNRYGLVVERLRNEIGDGTRPSLARILGP